MTEINICKIPGDARDITHEEWVKEVRKCPCDSVPVNEQDNFWTVGEAGYWIPKKTGDLSKDMKSVIQRKRSELNYNKKRGHDTTHLQKLVDDLTEFVKRKYYINDKEVTEEEYNRISSQMDFKHKY